MLQAVDTNTSPETIRPCEIKQKVAILRCELSLTFLLQVQQCRKGDPTLNTFAGG